MMKAMKKLKFWSTPKKKKKKNNVIIHTPPKTNSCCSCTPDPQPLLPPPQPWYEPETPSAPPLPSWPGQAHEPLFATGPGHAQSPFAQKEMVMDSGQCYSTSTMTSSYQQYMDPNPVYGVPIRADNVRRERIGGFFGCLVQFGISLIRCFCPCFEVLEVY